MRRIDLLLEKHGLAWVCQEACQTMAYQGHTAQSSPLSERISWVFDMACALRLARRMREHG